MKPKSVVIFSLSVLLGLCITLVFIYYTPPDMVFGSFESSNSALSKLGLLTAGVYGFGLTLIGVLLGALYRRLMQLKSQGVIKVQIRKLTTEVVQTPDFLIGLIGAPIVFGLIWQSLGQAEVAAYTVIALQNGFSANAIIAQFVNDPITKTDTISD